MQSLHNVHVLRLLVADREARLRPNLISGSDLRWCVVRRWVGLRIVSVGAWIAAERTTQPALAR